MMDNNQNGSSMYAHGNAVIPQRYDSLSYPYGLIYYGTITFHRSYTWKREGTRKIFIDR